tara:strand:+ start:2741 stop:2875 length:135 start_codon:yes stop_codon:yes gene_type:complete
LFKVAFLLPLSTLYEKIEKKGKNRAVSRFISSEKPKKSKKNESE